MGQAQHLAQDREGKSARRVEIGELVAFLVADQDAAATCVEEVARQGSASPSNRSYSASAVP